MDRNTYRTILAKRLINKMQIHLLAFDKKDELIIIDSLIKYTKNFVILIMKHEENIRMLNYQKHSCNQSSINTVLDCIFNYSEMEEKQIYKQPEDEIEYIVFIKGKNEDSNEISYYDFNVKSFYFSYLIGSLKTFKIYDYYFYNTNAILRITDHEIDSNFEINIIETDRKITNKKIILVPFVGIGDYFMFFSLLYEFITQKKEQNTEFYITVVDNNKSAIALINCFFPNLKRISFDNGAIYDYCLKMDNQDVLNLYYLHIKECMQRKYMLQGYHITEIIKSLLHLESSYYIYQHSDILKKRIKTNLSKEEKDYIDKFFENDNYVGFQFFTGSYDSINDIWTTDFSRVWEEENVQSFVDLCNNANIKLLVLSNSPYEDLPTYKLNNVSICGYAYAVSKIKLLVGIDSSAGHIASFYNVPTITMWGRQTPEQYRIPNLSIAEEQLESKISFRPLRKNLSIYSESRNINKIKPMVVFQKMVDILNGSILLEDKIISYDNFENMIKVE